LGRYCHECSCAPSSFPEKLQNGLRYETDPVGIEINDWRDPMVEIDAAASTVTVWADGEAFESPGFLVLNGPQRLMKFDIKVLLPDTRTQINASAASPTPRRPTDKQVEQCFRAIREKWLEGRPDDPPDEDELMGEMTNRLGTSPIRKRVRDLWKTIAPEWKRERGEKRKKKSAAV